MALREDLPATRWDGADGSLSIRRPAAGVVVVTIAGVDAGQFGDGPFEEIEKDLSDHRTIELFIDARAARAPTTDVSADWAHWLAENRNRFTAIRMLTGTPFVRISADFVRKYAGLGARMCVYTDPRAFDDELRTAAAAAE
ncbi:MAG: hypothetical protein M0D55_06015 [Elusimicrobiota bacterium]|nr:MAG: hypothetical protein M0D55_06015 [Elusimicrobiota bacterium]